MWSLCSLDTFNDNNGGQFLRKKPEKMILFVQYFSEVGCMEFGFMISYILFSLNPDNIANIAQKWLKQQKNLMIFKYF